MTTKKTPGLVRQGEGEVPGSAWHTDQGGDERWCAVGPWRQTRIEAEGDIPRKAAQSCAVEVYSSRICERGTKSCTVVHGADK